MQIFVYNATATVMIIIPEASLILCFSCFHIPMSKQGTRFYWCGEWMGKI